MACQPVRLSDRECVYRFARECQLLAGHLHRGSVPGREVRGILSSLLQLANSVNGGAAHAILSSLATQTLLRLRAAVALNPSRDAVLLADLSGPAATVGPRILERCLEISGCETGGSGILDGDRNSTRVASALDYVRANYADCRLRLEAVARSVNISTWHLDHLLKRYTGHAFRHHLRLARTQAAEALLSTSHLTVKEIAALVGYNSTTQLDRDFRRRHGCPPRVWVNAYHRLKGHVENAVVPRGAGRQSLG